jgi:hypothetical protein
MFARRVSARTLGELAALFALSLGIAGLAAPGTAQAAGTSSSVMNCYTQWWNTAWAQKCSAPGAAFTGSFESKIACSAQGDKYLTVGRAQHSTATVSGSDCAHSASNGSITYYV